MVLTVSAPAKLNRYLGVLGRRADGFHEVELITTVLEGLEALTDTLTWEPHDRLELTLTGPTATGLVADETNLVLRAWRLVEAFAGRPCPARLTLHKRIPHGAGLGGGSSDAAAALRLIDQALGLELTEAMLLGFAAELGSDVPLFLLGGTVWGRGRGERVQAVAAPPLPPLLLVNPGLHAPTPAVYRALGEVGYPATTPLADPSAAPWQNDLEAAALKVCPAMAPVKDALVRLGGEPLLCGSGSSWAGRFTSPEAVEAAATALRASHPHWGVWAL